MRIISERSPQDQSNYKDSDPFITISQTDSLKYELSIIYPTGIKNVSNLRFRAKSLEELIPLSASSIKDDLIRQWVRDIVYDSEDLEFNNHTASYTVLDAPTPKSAQVYEPNGDTGKEANSWRKAKKAAQRKATLAGSQIRSDEGNTEVYVTDAEIRAELILGEGDEPKSWTPGPISRRR